MFYCRNEELRKLNKRYDNGNFECVVIYGRRRVGKTTIINEFCKEKPTIFFSALLEGTAKDNLKTLGRFNNEDIISTNILLSKKYFNNIT